MLPSFLWLCSARLFCPLSLPFIPLRLFLGCLATSSHSRCLEHVWTYHNKHSKSNGGCMKTWRTDHFSHGEEDESWSGLIGSVPVDDSDRLLVLSSEAGCNAPVLLLHSDCNSCSSVSCAAETKHLLTTAYEHMKYSLRTWVQKRVEGSLKKDKYANVWNVT